MSSTINGLDRLLGKLKSLGASVEPIMEKAVGKQAKKVQASAKLLCAVNNGELRNSIHTMTEVTDGRVQGIVYTNKKYAPYVEFGTGPIGEQNHAGISPEVSPSYSQSPWWIHESQIDKADAERYHFFKIETAEGVFYRTNGQPAQPFMYLVLKVNEPNITKGIQEDLRQEIMKVIRSK